MKYTYILHIPTGLFLSYTYGSYNNTRILHLILSNEVSSSRNNDDLYCHIHKLCWNKLLIHNMRDKVIEEATADEFELVERNV